MGTLEDLRVVDLSTTPAGAYCTRLFAGLGAEVILFEPPAGSPLRRLPNWSDLGAGKLSVTLDIHTRTGLGIFRRFVEQANLVVETFGEGVMDTLGLGFDDLYAIKRRIILCSLSPGGDRSAGLNAFAASMIAVHNADAYEVPQHIGISADECSAVFGEAGVLPDPPFAASSLGWELEPAPRPGSDTADLLGDKLHLATPDVLRLRAAGVI
jgi:crotonobetainyl-CoA:carnitine CoA-transferase CaiB-like acyl-CoA transferase